MSIVHSIEAVDGGYRVVVHVGELADGSPEAVEIATVPDEAVKGLRGEKRDAELARIAFAGLPPHLRP